MNLADLTDAQYAAFSAAAYEPARRRGRLVISTTGKNWGSGWVHPKTAEALVKRGLFEYLQFGGEIRWTDAGAKLAAPIIKQVEEIEALPDLTVGQTVRVYRVGNQQTLIMELVDQYKEWMAAVPPSTEPFETGILREQLDDRCEPQERLYRVTVTRGDDRDLFIDWTSRYYIRLPHEPAPGTCDKDA